MFEYSSVGDEVSVWLVGVSFYGYESDEVYSHGSVMGDAYEAGNSAAAYVVYEYVAHSGACEVCSVCGVKVGKGAGKSLCVCDGVTVSGV